MSKSGAPSAESGSLAKQEKSNPRRERRLDWARFTDFRSRNSREDLVNLCANLKGAQKRDAFNTADKTGLYPIHWAAIHNRSDMVEYMLGNGSSATKRCRNKLFANGTPLHLAAMNGSIEVAAVLIAKLSGKKSKAQEKKAEKRDQKDAANNDDDEDEENDKDDRKSKKEKGDKNWLEERDAEGQTPLMRSAAPKSRRFDLIRDLLRKNFWSLSGRPAEMAFFLICNGADWHQTEPTNGMNLLHLAIVNGYDDIVTMLLTIDKDLLDTRVTLKQQNETSVKPTSPASKQVEPPKSSSPAFTTVSLSGPSTAQSTAPSTPSSDKPLIDGKEKTTERLVAEGLDALMLAIVYGRISIISLLWHAKTNQEQQAIDGGNSSAIKVQHKALKKQTHDSQDLRRILWKACCTNSIELTMFLKHTILKGLLILDLVVLTFLWAPTYSAGRTVISTCKGGAFFLGYGITLALAFRVMLKNPGYLRRNSVQYFNEATRMLRKNSEESAKKKKMRKNFGPSPKPEVRSGQGGKSELNLIKLESPQTSPKQLQQQDTVGSETKGQNSNAATAAESSQPERQPEARKEKDPLSDLRVPSWQPNSELNDRVRLLCHKCRCVRRPRTKHCNSCNHCVQDFDHHCIYLGCCIGRNNRMDFLLTMISLAITGIYGTLVQLVTPSSRSAFCHLLGLVWIAKYALIGTVGSFLTLRRACLGVTKFEEIRSNRIRKIFGAQGTPEEISKSHKAYSILKGSFWRYLPDRFLTGELSAQKILSNWKEFSNNLKADEYLLSLICSDTAIARALTSSDTRLNTYQFA